MTLTKKITSALAGLALLVGNVEAKDLKKDFVSRLYLFSSDKKAIGNFDKEYADGRIQYPWFLHKDAITGKLNPYKPNLSFSEVLEREDHIYKLSCDAQYLPFFGTKTVQYEELSVGLYVVEGTRKIKTNEGLYRTILGSGGMQRGKELMTVVPDPLLPILDGLRVPYHIFPVELFTLTTYPKHEWNLELTLINKTKINREIIIECISPIM